jgi:hypothetical protein
MMMCRIGTMERTMKYFNSISILIALLALFPGCSKEEESPASSGSTVVGWERWLSVMDGDSLSHGDHTITKYSDGTITTSGTWYYNNSGTDVVCPFINGPVTVNDSIVTFTASGTATYAGAPAGYQASPFTFSTNGVAISGKAHGTYTITFTTMGWPPKLEGTFTSTRFSGTKVTK